MLEIEMKFAIADFGAIEQQLEQWGARAGAPLDEADHYFNAPDRDFAKTDEAFRLRRIGTNNRITYKGPKQGGPAKTRTEVELALESGPAAGWWNTSAIVPSPSSASGVFPTISTEAVSPWKPAATQ